ncbi:MAG: electron transfer flavoprotein subunit alpha/FixB family protein [Bacteroidota bacterium]|nr:electron transfer flavoprotein subunit alpha/FixB family protein [Bacteroidota bacterium]MDP3145176.1 electron transfer flavoprotein subunit alpha/FixB family protein [Bacteroidota bacterium]MDP3557298.1 electron transfer flavoprotein subunit alpha/FixB family protein [Bacteroidota bacterium]
MSVLVYTEINKGRVKKASLECVNYASKIAELTGSTVTAIVNNATTEQLEEIGKAGATKILLIKDDKINSDAMFISAAVEQAVKSENTKIIVFAFDIVGKAVAPRLAAKLKAGLVAGAVDYPTINGDSFEVKKNVFSGKATAIYSITSDLKVISLLPNSYPVKLSDNKATVTDFAVDLSNINSKIVIKEIKSNDVGGMIPLPEAELVVSAGRGLKGPENWKIVEDLASALGATTACSRPVADMHWRPHHEHVGQTGVAIRPNLYIAIGISGAIQHLAGVNGSKTIVVINNDKEAPFFKSADYGVIGDAFTIVPKLTEAVKKFKANQN